MPDNIDSTSVSFVALDATRLFFENSTIPFGGAEVQMRFIARELAKDAGFSVNFFVSGASKKKQVIDDVCVTQIGKKAAGSFFGKIRQAGNLFSALQAADSDTILTRSGGPALFVCWLYARLNRKRLVYSIAHEQDIEPHPSPGLLRRVFDFAFERVDHLVAQTKDQLRLIHKHHADKVSSTTVIPNSFPPPENVGDKNQKGYILWVGRAAEVKRPHVFLDLAKTLPEEDFVMICQRENDDIFTTVQERVSDIENVVFKDYVPFSEIDDYFQRAELFVNTSHKEGFPNTFIQSTRAGTPIVSLAVDPDNVIMRNRLGVVCDNDFSAFVSQVNALLGDTAKYREIAEHCGRYAIQNHSIENNIESWKRVLRNVDPELKQ